MAKSKAKKTPAKKSPAKKASNGPLPDRPGTRTIKIQWVPSGVFYRDREVEVLDVESHWTSRIRLFAPRGGDVDVVCETRRSSSTKDVAVAILTEHLDALFRSRVQVSPDPDDDDQVDNQVDDQGDDDDDDDDDDDETDSFQ